MGGRRSPDDLTPCRCGLSFHATCIHLRSHVSMQATQQLRHQATAPSLMCFFPAPVRTPRSLLGTTPPCADPTSPPSLQNAIGISQYLRQRQAPAASNTKLADPRRHIYHPMLRITWSHSASCIVGVANPGRRGIQGRGGTDDPRTRVLMTLETTTPDAAFHWKARAIQSYGIQAPGP